MSYSADIPILGLPSRVSDYLFEGLKHFVRESHSSSCIIAFVVSFPGKLICLKTWLCGGRLRTFHADSSDELGERNVSGLQGLEMSTIIRGLVSSHS